MELLLAMEQLTHISGWIHGSGAKSIRCSCRGPRFTVLCHWHWEAHLWSRGVWWPPLASIGTMALAHIYIHTYTQFKNRNAFQTWQLPGCIWSLITASLLSISPLLNTAMSSESSDQAMHLTAESQSFSPLPPLLLASAASLTWLSLLWLHRWLPLDGI